MARPDKAAVEPAIGFSCLMSATVLTEYRGPECRSASRSLRRSLAKV